MVVKMDSDSIPYCDVARKGEVYRIHVRFARDGNGSFPKNFVPQEQGNVRFTGLGCGQIVVADLGQESSSSGSLRQRGLNQRQVVAPAGIHFQALSLQVPTRDGAAVGALGSVLCKWIFGLWYLFQASKGCQHDLIAPAGRGCIRACGQPRKANNARQEACLGRPPPPCEGRLDPGVSTWTRDLAAQSDHEAAYPDQSGSRSPLSNQKGRAPGQAALTPRPELAL